MHLRQPVLKSVGEERLLVIIWNILQRQQVSPFRGPVNLYGKKVVYLPCMLYVCPEENGGQFKQAHVVPAKPLALGKGSAKVGRK